MTYDTDKLTKTIKDHGFDKVGILNTDALVFMPEVRAMCAADKCRNYNKSWSCPPACGTLADSQNTVRGYTFGMIFETVGNMEDEFDYETISETSAKHSKNTVKLISDLKKEYPDIVGMSAGTCRICEKCAYPDAPCRHDDMRLISMEAYGLFVSDVCKKSGMPYNNGPLTTTFISCFLLK
ncbi:MAG: DUF2284 domain-containing protein [Clostridia bacterium]|nr:DUF2284 domain-containing protein [Clostridia bacterium]